VPNVTSWDDVRRLTLALPGTSEAPSHDGLPISTPYFNGYPAVLVRLKQITVADLEEVVVEAWLDRAPRRLAAQYLNQRPERS
jgi:hypothetical protein